MSWTDNIKKRLWRADKRQREEDTANSGSLLNRSYHKYFEGYTEYTVKKPNGKEKIERIYTAKYYRQHLDKSQYVSVRILFAALALAAVILFVYGSIQDVSYNYVWYTTICEAISIPFLFLLWVFLIGYIFADKNLVIHNYNLYHRQLMNMALCGSIFLALTPVSMFINLIITRSVTSASYLPLLADLLAAAALFVINRIEGSIDYDLVDNPNAAKNIPGGIEISNVSKSRK